MVLITELALPHMPIDCCSGVHVAGTHDACAGSQELVVLTGSPPSGSAAAGRQLPASHDNAIQIAIQPMARTPEWVCFKLLLPVFVRSRERRAPGAAASDRDVADTACCIRGDGGFKPSMSAAGVAG